MDDGGLRALLDAERTRFAADDRGRRRRLREQATEEATLAGALLDVAETCAGVVVASAAGRTHHGTIAGVGADFVTLHAKGGRRIYVAWWALTTVRMETGVRMGDPGCRDDVDDRTLVEVLSALAPQRPSVSVGVGGADPVSGELQWVGADVLAVQMGRDPGTLALVHADAIADVAVDDV